MNVYILRQHISRFLLGGLLLLLSSILMLGTLWPLWIVTGIDSWLLIVSTCMISIFVILLLLYSFKDLKAFFTYKKFRWLEMKFDGSQFYTFGTVAPGVFSEDEPLVYQLESTSISFKDHGWYKDLVLMDKEKRLIIPGLSRFIDSSCAQLGKDLIEAKNRSKEGLIP